MRTRLLVPIVLALVACSGEQPAEKEPSPSPAEPASIAARAPAGTLKRVPWLLGTFRGAGVQGTVQEPFFERYTLADDSTLVVESFKDSTLSGPRDTARFEVRRDSLTSLGEHRYVAVAVSPDSLSFGPLAGVNTSFTWKRGDTKGWNAIIIAGANGTQRRYYRMERLK